MHYRLFIEPRSSVLLPTRDSVYLTLESETQWNVNTKQIDPKVPITVSESPIFHWSIIVSYPYGLAMRTISYDYFGRDLIIAWLWDKNVTVLVYIYIDKRVWHRTTIPKALRTSFTMKFLQMNWDRDIDKWLHPPLSEGCNYSCML